MSKKEIVIKLAKKANQLCEKADYLADIFDDKDYYEVTKRENDFMFIKTDLEKTFFDGQVYSRYGVLSTEEIIDAILYIMEIDENSVSEFTDDYDKILSCGLVEVVDDKNIYDYEDYYNTLIELSKRYPIN